MAQACPNCNNQVEIGANFCPNCGQDMNVVVPQDQRIPTEDTGVPPPPTPQGQGTGRGRGVQIAFIGCGGLIGLFLLLVIAIALSEDQDTTKDQKQDRAEDKPKKAKSDVGVREDAMMGDRVLRVEEFEGNYRPPREFDRPDPGNEFVRVQVTLSNTSNQPFSINPLDFELQDSAGVQRQRELITDLPNAIDLGSIAAGGTLRGNIVFEAPQGDSNLKLVYAPSSARDVHATVTL